MVRLTAFSEGCLLVYHSIIIITIAVILVVTVDDGTKPESLLCQSRISEPIEKLEESNLDQKVAIKEETRKATEPAWKVEELQEENGKRYLVDDPLEQDQEDEQCRNFFGIAQDFHFMF